MQSMTGYGRGLASGTCGTLTVEISAVNSRKQVDLRCSIPRELGMMEQQIRQAVQQKFSRGSLYLSVSYQLNPQAQNPTSNIDHEAFRNAARELSHLVKSAGLPHHPTVSDILMIPGVLANGQTALYENFKLLLPTALETALAELTANRVKEGIQLKADLIGRGNTIRTLLEKIEARGDEALKQLQGRLKARLIELGATISDNDERLAKELVFFAERADITEEIVRLKSHIVKYFQLLEAAEPGRELEFLGQEMNREITTLASKTADLCISHDALALKIELSKIREQIMNIE